MIKAITFDCWDTLLADDKSRNLKRKEFFISIFKENGHTVTMEKIDEFFVKEAKLFQDYIIANRKTQNSSERVETLLDLSGCDIPLSHAEKLADYCDTVALEFRPPVVPGVKDALESLTGKYRLAVICNTGWHSGGTVMKLLEDYGFPKYFTHFTFSNEAGIAKPHKHIFEYTLEKIGIEPVDAAHIGDSEYSDIIGAKKAGMKTILFTGINDRYRDNNTADISISNYDNLLEIIKNV